MSAAGEMEHEVQEDRREQDERRGAAEKGGEGVFCGGGEGKGAAEVAVHHGAQHEP